MKSKCPYCNHLNDSHKNRKNRLRFSDLFDLRFHIPFFSKDIPEFKTIICGKCDKEYSEKNITVFGISPRYSWILPISVAILFCYMLFVAHQHGQ